MNSTILHGAGQLPTYERPEIILTYELFVLIVCIVLCINVDGISRIFKIITCVAATRVCFLVYIASYSITIAALLFIHLILIALQINATTCLFLMYLKYSPPRMISLIVYSLMTMILISLGISGSNSDECTFFLVMGILSVTIQTYFVLQNNINEVNQGTDELPALAGWYPVLMTAAFVYMFWRSPTCSTKGIDHMLPIFVIDIVQTCVFVSFVSLRVHMVMDTAFFDISSDSVL